MSQTERPRGPKGELLDLIERTGPKTVDGIVDVAGMWAPDTVYMWLRELEDDGYLKSEANNFAEHGTTRRVWFVSENADR